MVSLSALLNKIPKIGLSMATRVEVGWGKAMHGAVQPQNHVKMFLNLSPFPWETIVRNHCKKSLSDSCQTLCGAPSKQIHHPGSRGWMVAHSHSDSCSTKQPGTMRISDLYFLLVSAIVTLSDSSDPVACLLF